MNPTASEAVHADPPAPVRHSLRTRFIIGTALLLVVLFLVGVDAWIETVWGTTFLTVLLAAWGWHEYTGIVLRPPRGFLRWVGLVAVLYFLGMTWWQFRWQPSAEAFLLAQSLGVYLTVTLFFLGACLQRDFERRFAQVAAALFGVFYLGYLLGFALRIRYLDHGLYLMAVWVLVVKGNDIGAYLTGRALGRRRLSPVSPKKTVEGCIGGLITGTLVLCLASWFRPEALFSWQVSVVAGIIIGVFSQLGDLFESLIKRNFQVKDSGNLIPEFGGILDLLDSPIFGAPAFYFLLKL